MCMVFICVCNHVRLVCVLCSVKTTKTITIIIVIKNRILSLFQMLLYLRNLLFSQHRNTSKTAYKNVPKPDQHIGSTNSQLVLSSQ